MEARSAGMYESPPAPPPEERARVFEVAPEEDLLSSLLPDGRRRYIHPVLHRGRHWRRRRALASLLLAVFVALPLVPVGGRPALLLDLSARQFHVLGATFHPTDNLLLAAFGVGLVVALFFVGATFGRLWCGYACPQTVFLEFVFRPIETWLEGRPAQQARLAREPWGPRKLAIRSARWALWTLAALGISASLVAIFVGWDHLLGEVVARPLANRGAAGVVLFLAAAALFDFAWFRDQMCTLACPYGRLQGVLADPDTILVAYDPRRGEPRAPLKARRPGEAHGDCVECRACVTTCPTGVDIRRGLQLECIACAQCVDACDGVMGRLGQPPGLVRETSERDLAGGGRRFFRPRVAVYLALLVVAWGTLAVLVATRGEALVEVVRGGREPYRLLPTGEVANQQRLRITNQRGEPQAFTVEVLTPPAARLVLGESPVVVAPARVATVNAVTTVPASLFVDGQAPVRYLVRSDRGFRREVDFLLLGPYREGEGR